MDLTEALKECGGWFAAIMAALGVGKYAGKKFDEAVDDRITKAINPPLLHATLKQIAAGVESNTEQLTVLDTKLDVVVRDVERLKGKEEGRSLVVPSGRIRVQPQEVD